MGHRHFTAAALWEFAGEAGRFQSCESRWEECEVPRCIMSFSNIYSHSTQDRIRCKLLEWYFFFEAETFFGSFSRVLGRPASLIFSGCHFLASGLWSFYLANMVEMPWFAPFASIFPFVDRSIVPSLGNVQPLQDAYCAVVFAKGANSQL